MSYTDLVEAWRAGDTTYHNLHGAPVALRIRGEMVETSHGAHVPLADAIRLWPMLLAARAEGRAVHPATPPNLGHYLLWQINPDGSIIVGTHGISFSEMARVAEQLGLIKETVC